MFTPNKNRLSSQTAGKITHYKQIIMKKQNNSKDRWRTVRLFHICPDGFEAGNNSVNFLFGKLFARLNVSVVVASKHDISEAVARNWVVVDYATPRQR